MREKGYYSVRTGKNPDGAKLTLPAAKKLFRSVFNNLVSRDYFQEALGYHCVDAGPVPGLLGEDVAGTILVALRKDDLWPIDDRLEAYSEDDLFDMVEFLYDHVSKPIDGYFHSYGGCGTHYSTFNRHDGQEEFRSALNPILVTYADGFSIAADGDVLHLPEKGLEPLLAANLPHHDPHNVEARVNAAVARFRRHRSSLEDRRHALRDLADVLEYLRPKVKEVLDSKDEADLFNIANNFGLRHHNPKQKTNYDSAIWYSWLFYFYLATIHACLRLLERSPDNGRGDNRAGRPRSI